MALYYCSPLQLLLLFLGRFEVERPSDGVLRLLGRTARLRCAWSRAVRMVTNLVKQEAAMLQPNCSIWHLVPHGVRPALHGYHLPRIIMQKDTQAHACRA